MTMAPRPTSQGTTACRLTWQKTCLLLMLLPALLSTGRGDAAKRIGPKSKQPTSAPAARSPIYPPDRSVIGSRTVQIIATVADSQGQTAVTVNGKPLETRRMRIKTHGSSGKRPAAEPAEGRHTVLVGSTSLPPGQHVIAVGAHKARICVDPSKDRANAPTSWPVFRPHPGRVANCALCHTLKETDGAPLLGTASEPDACFACHDLDEFKLVHSHRLESLAACQMCHAPHGGTTKAMLIDNPKALCAKCHD